jgi:hypothetical protein
VLDLEAGVDLEKVERAGDVVDEELDGARRPVVDRPRQAQRGVAHGGPQVGVDDRRRRLLDDLLVAPLDRALAFAEVHETAVGVAQDLDLDVARPRHIALEEHAVVAEAARSLPPGGGHRLGQVVGRLDDAHALAAAARGRLDQQRVPDLAGRGRVVGRGQGRHTRRRRGALGGQLVAHRLDHPGRGPDPGEPGGRHVGGEGGVLGEEAVAGVDRLGAGRQRGGDDAGTVQVAARQAHGLVGLGDERAVGVGIGVDRHAPQAHGARRAEHAPRDLPPVRDQHAAEQGGPHRRKTP